MLFYKNIYAHMGP